MNFFTEYQTTVKEDWIDYNGHMNVMYYIHVFDHAMRGLLDALDLGEAYRAREEKSLFAVEAHVTYDREASLGDRLVVKSRVLSFDAKRLLLFSEIFHADKGHRVSSHELLMVHVDKKLRKAAPLDTIYEKRLNEWVKAANAEGYSAENTRKLKELTNSFG